MGEGRPVHFEERNGWPYFIVEGPDGQMHGFWDRQTAEAVANAPTPSKDKADG